MSKENIARKINPMTERRYMLLMDVLVVILCIATAIFIGFSSFPKELSFTLFWLQCIVHGAMVIGFMIAFEEYELSASDFRGRGVSIILSGLFSLILILLGNLILVQSTWLAMQQLILAAGFLIVMFFTNRLLYRFLRNDRFFQKQKLLVLAETDDMHFSRMKRLKYGALAHFDSWYETIDSSKPETLNRMLDEELEDFDAVCIFDNFSDDIYERIVKKAMRLNKEVFAVPKVIDINRNQGDYVCFDDILAFHIRKYALTNTELLLKRAFDIVASLIAIILAAIPMLIIAAAIKLTSPGPVFYRQLRYTQNKKEFYIWKFRTMVPNAEKLSGPTLAQKNDPRITKVGAILRSCRLDELPQLFNILTGDMSVVGPRPERPFFVEQFEKEIDNYDYRFVVKAGLTSLSHVYGRYSTYIHDRTCYDLMYISNYSFLLDLKIILLTAKTMFLPSAAEGEDEFKNPNNNKKERTVQ